MASSPQHWSNPGLALAAALTAIILAAGNASAFISVTDFGATGDGRSDCTSAIQAAINSAKAGDTIYFPAGMYLVSDSIVISNLRGLRLYGDGVFASAIIGSGAVARKPVLRFIDDIDDTVEDLSIWGQMSAPASAGIESDSANGGPATHLTVRDVEIGSPAANNIVDGIKFVADPGSDAANDQGFFDNVMIANFTHAGFSFTHPSANLHTIVGGIIEDGPTAVYSQGASFKMTGTTLLARSLNFDLENSSDSSVSGYQHAVLIANTTSEGNAALLQTGTDPMMVAMTGIDEKGSAWNIPILTFASSGSLVISDSYFFYLGQNVALQFVGGPSQTINLSNNFFGLKNVTIDGGGVISRGNCWQFPINLTQASSPRIVSADQCNPLYARGRRQR